MKVMRKMRPRKAAEGLRGASITGRVYEINAKRYVVISSG